MNELNAHSRVVAVTGASGLLGRNLCDYFRGKGWNVHALMRDTLKYPFSGKGIKVFRFDLPGIIDIKSIEKVDVLIHCAYMTRFTNLDEARRVNEDGTIRLYELARKYGVKKFVFISSRAARSNAQSYYAQSKYRLEKMMDTSRDLIIRPGLILAKDGGLFHRVVNLVQRLPVIPVFDGGGQILKTVHVEDLCKVILWAIENDHTGVITVAEAEGIRMKGLIQEILKSFKKRKLIVSLPGMPMVKILRLFELMGIKLPVSSENLLGLLYRDEGEVEIDGERFYSFTEVRSFHESLKSLF